MLDNMVCQGQEVGLSECDYERYENGNVNCDHTEDAGVRCEGIYMYICKQDYTYIIKAFEALFNFKVILC